MLGGEKNKHFKRPIFNIFCIKIIIYKNIKKLYDRKM